MPSQASSVGHDPVLRSTADGAAFSRDAAADRCRHGGQSIVLCLIYKAGDFIIEAIGQCHRAVNLDDRPLKLLVIDRQADEKSNAVVRK
jgi:hypothetical protein